MRTLVDDDMMFKMKALLSYQGVNSRVYCELGYFEDNDGEDNNHQKQLKDNDDEAEKTGILCQSMQ